MINWLHEIEIEVGRTRQSEHPGRTRTIARRIAGIALRQLSDAKGNSPAGEDYMTALRTFIRSDGIPEEVRAAASRLEARLTPDFTSPSTDPIADAMVIVDFVKETLRLSGASGADRIE